MNLFLLIVAIFLNFGAFAPQIALAQTLPQTETNSFVTIVNPVRGPDFFQGAKNPLETPTGQLEVIKKYNLPATWLLRFDAYSNLEIAAFFQKVPKTHELGIFFEITSTLTGAAGVTYNQSDSWHKAKSVFLTGYTLSDRKKIITTAFEKFRQVFGFYPKSVGAWWIDANSLNFMQQKYGITTNLVVADQFSTDDYQVWGMPYSTAFYPSKKNALVPAQSPEAKIGTVAIQWAQRDPFNAYGPGVQESTYSVQANDYIVFHQFDTSYFEKLLDLYAKPNFFNQFGQATVGLENTFSWEGFGEELENQIKAIVARKLEGKIQVVTMSQFASWYQKKFPLLSPSNLVTTNDPMGGPGKVVWFNSNFYRVGWFYHPDLYGSSIRDLRLYNDSLPEPCYATACANLDLGLSVSKPLDEATFGDRWTIDEGQIFDFKIENIDEVVRLSYKNAAGKLRALEFGNQDLGLDGEGVAVSEAILRTLNLPKPAEGKISLKFASEKFEISILQILSKGAIFLIFVIFLFLFPGLWLIHFFKLELGLQEKLVIGSILGLVIFVLLSFLLSWIKLQFLAFIILISLSFYQIIVAWKNFEKPQIHLTPKILFLVFLIFLGTASQAIPVVKSGLPYNFGLGFWGPNGHDGVWHLAVIESLVKNFPPQNPILAGEPLRNYHYFYDLLIAVVHNLTKIPVIDLYFRFFPIFISALFGLIIFVLVKKLTKSDGASLSAVFLSYFGGSFGWIVTWFQEGKFGGESMFWANQSVSFLLNPPFAISVVIFLIGLLIFSQFLQNPKKALILPIAILWGSLIQFKAYAGVLVLISLALLTILGVLFKRTFQFLKLLVPTGLVSLLVFLPNNFGASSLLVFSPFWLIHTMVEYQDRFFWLRLANARNAYLAQGWWGKLVAAEILGLAIFLVGNLGTRILVFGQIFNWVKNKFRIGSFQLFLAVFSVLAIVLPLLFIQKGTAWNTIQFFYYFQVIAGIFAAIFFWQIISKFPQLAKVIAVALLVLATIPTTSGTFSHYLPSRPPARLPYGEFEALEFLRKLPDGQVLTRAFDKSIREKFDLPLPLFAYETTAYVAAFSAKPVFVEDEINLEIIGANYKDRVIGAKEFFKTRDENFAKEFLRKNNIKYIFVTKFERFEPNERILQIKKIFENDEAKIYEVL